MHQHPALPRLPAEKVWGTDGNGSGRGSSLEKTVKTRANLLTIIEELNIQSMIDVPCGAMMWMPLVLEEVAARKPQFRYLGLDIARNLVEANTFRGELSREAQLAV